MHLGTLEGPFLPRVPQNLTHRVQFGVHLRNHKGQGGSPVPWCKVMRNIYFEGKGANIRKVKILHLTYFFGLEHFIRLYFKNV